MPIKNFNNPQCELTQWLLGLMEEYIDLNDLDNDGNTFGWLACKDATMVQRLRDGGDISIGKMCNALAFMQRPGEYRAKNTDTVYKPLKPLTLKPRSLP